MVSAADREAEEQRKAAQKEVRRVFPLHCFKLFICRNSSRAMRNGGAKSSRSCRRMGVQGKRSSGCADMLGASSSPGRSYAPVTCRN